MVKAPETRRPHRSSDRLLLAIPVRIRGRDAEGKPFNERTQTEKISRNGLAVLLSHRVNAGTTVALCLGETNTIEAQVASVGATRASGQTEVGLAVENCDRFFGVSFPQPVAAAQPPPAELSRPSLDPALPQAAGTPPAEPEVENVELGNIMDACLNEFRKRLSEAMAAAENSFRESVESVARTAAQHSADAMQSYSARNLEAVKNQASQVEADTRHRMEEYSQKKIAATCEKFIEKLEQLLPALEASTCHSINHGVKRVAHDAQEAAMSQLAAEIRGVAAKFRDELRQHVQEALVELKKQSDAQGRAAAETLAKKSESLREDFVRTVSADVDQKRRAAIDSITGEATIELEAHARHSVLAALSDIAGQLDQAGERRELVAGADDEPRAKRPAAGKRVGAAG